MIWKRGQANGRRSSNQNPKNKNRLVSSNLCAWLLSPWHYSQGLLLKATPKPPGRNMNLLLIMCHRWLEPKTNSIACHEILVGENEFPLKSYNKSWVYHLESRKGATSNAMVYHSPLLFGVAPSTLTTVFILPSNRYFCNPSRSMEPEWHCPLALHLKATVTSSIFKKTHTCNIMFTPF